MYLGRIVSNNIVIGIGDFIDKNKKDEEEVDNFLR